MTTCKGCEGCCRDDGEPVVPASSKPVHDTGLRGRQSEEAKTRGFHQGQGIYRPIKRPDICEQPDLRPLQTALRPGWVHICHKKEVENQRRAPRKFPTAYMIPVNLTLTTSPPLEFGRGAVQPVRMRITALRS